MESPPVPITSSLSELNILLRTLHSRPTFPFQYKRQSFTSIRKQQAVLQLCLTSFPYQVYEQSVETPTNVPHHPYSIIIFNNVPPGHLRMFFCFSTRSTALRTNHTQGRYVVSLRNRYVKSNVNYCHLVGRLLTAYQILTVHWYLCAPKASFRHSTAYPYSA